MKQVNHYTDRFKESVIREVLEGGESLASVSRKYGIGGKTTISRWIAKFKASTSSVTLMSKEQKSKEELLAEIELLKRQLFHQKLRADAYDTMIDIAESELNIDIRKKSGAKQSKDLNQNHSTQK